MATLYILQDKNKAYPDQEEFEGSQENLGAGVPTWETNSSTSASNKSPTRIGSEPTLIATTHEQERMTKGSSPVPGVTMTTSRGATSHSSDRKVSLAQTRKPTSSSTSEFSLLSLVAAMN